MRIKVLGCGCTKCNLTEEIVRKVFAQDGFEAEIETIRGHRKVAEHGVFLPPAVVINGEVKTVGKIPRIEEIRAWTQ